ncbi:MAG TPA: immunoglobulin domain-containing protein, partial [Verrucomicrobiae bacterium]|nr:immunoglobulin domain-containing protein [Verrucomicrobiae bacterium]
MKAFAERAVFSISSVVILTVAFGLFVPRALLAASAPTITTQPRNQTNLLGANATFNVVANGQLPLFYQWSFNGTNLVNSAHIGGATNSILVVSNVAAGDTGNYLVVVSNSHGSATSSNATLTVLIPASITSEPASQSVSVGSNVAFTASATGTAPLICQWYLNGAPLVDGGEVSGSATTNLNVSNVQTNDAGNYQLIVTNNYGSSTSVVAVLTVGFPPAIVQQPTNQSAQWGADAGFSVVANGTTPLNYQWTFNGTNLAGATSSILLLTNLQPAQAGSYAVTITNAYGSVVSSNATLTLTQPPPGVPFIAGFSPPMAFPGATLTITGTNFSSVAGSNTVYFGAVQAPVVSASVTNLVVTVPHGATFSAISETVGGLTAYANAPFLPTFLSGGIFTNTSLGSQIVLPSGSGPNKVVIADIDGDGKPDLIVSDDYGSSISVYRNISTNGVLGTNSFAMPVTLPATSGQYSPWGLVVADVDGDGKPDIIVTDDSLPLISIYRNTSTPGSLSSNSFAARVDLPAGNTPLAVEVRDMDGDGKPDLVVANANDGTVSIFRNTGSPGSLTTNSFAPRVDFPTGAGCEDVKVADLDGDGLPDIVTANNGAGTVSVLRNLGTPGSITTNSFAPAVNIPVLSEPVQLAIGDLDGDGKPDITVTFYLPQMTVSVLRNISTVGSLTANSFAAHVDFALGGRGHTPQLADLDGSGKPDLAVVTELNSLLSIFKNVSTPGTFTGSSLGPRMDFATGYNAWGMAIGDLDGDGRPDIVFANSYDNTISIYQNQVPLGGPPLISAQPQNQTVIIGSNAVFSVTASGSLPLTYQWLFNGTNLPGATNNPLVLSNVLASQSGSYSVIVSNSYGIVVSSNATLTAVPLMITGQPQNQSVLAGTNVSFTVSVNGQQPFFYQWLYDGTNLPNATNNPLVLSNVLTSQSGTYSVEVSNSYGMAVSSNATLTVTPLLISTQPSNQVAWPNGFATFKVNVSGQAPFAFEWQCNGADVPGTWSNVLTLTNLQLQQFGTYRVIVSNVYGSVASSNATLFSSQVAVWGGNSGETNLPAGLTNIIAIAGGGYARMDCLALRNNGRAIHWPTTNLTTVTNNLLAIQGGGAQNAPFLVLQRNSTVATWLVDDIIEPLTGFTNDVAIAPNIYTPLALRPNGTLVGGSPGTTGSGAPTNIFNAVAVAEGSGFGMALKADGTVTAWGNNNYGQTNPPPGLSNVVAIAAGYYHALALKSDGTVTAWGLNNYGQIYVPLGLSNVVAIAAGVYHSLALQANGTVVAWGYNLYGQTNVPPGLTNVVAIAAGAYHSMALIGSGPPVTGVLLAGPYASTNGFTISLPSQSGRVYVLQYKNSLSDTNWNSLPLVPGNGGTLLLTDPS